MTFGLVLDVVVATLLVATIAYCAVLHRRLNEFRAASGEMKNAMAAFTQAMLRAEASTAGLKKAALDVGEELQARIDAARAISNELQFLSEDAHVPAAGTAPRRPVPELAGGLADSGLLAEEAARSEAERELLQAMRQVR